VLPDGCRIEPERRPNAEGEYSLCYQMLLSAVMELRRIAAARAAGTNPWGGDACEWAQFEAMVDHHQTLLWVADPTRGELSLATVCSHLGVSVEAVQKMFISEEKRRHFLREAGTAGQTGARGRLKRRPTGTEYGELGTDAEWTAAVRRAGLPESDGCW